MKEKGVSIRRTVFDHENKKENMSPQTSMINAREK